MVYESEIDQYRTWWRRTRVVSQGFQKAYRAKTPAKDILLVEFNFHESLVKLQIEPYNENGATYTATIKKGMIIRERDVLNGLNFSLSRKFYPYRILFSCLPDEDILESLGGAYDISRIPLFKTRGTNRIAEVPADTEFFKPEIEDSWYKKFIGKFQSPRESVNSYFTELKERAVDDVNDSVMGFSMAAVLYFHFFDFVVLGWSLAVFGFLFGGIDWVIRNRTPLILKVLLFLSAGSYFFYTGYTRF